MSSYVVTRKSDGAEVLRYSASEAQSVNGYDLVDYEHTEAADEPLTAQAVFGGRRILTKLEFRSLFPEVCIKAIDRFEAQFEAAAFLTDGQKDDIRTSLKNYSEALDINLDDPRWGPGLGLYAALGMMSADDVAEVLRG